jgi:hypothetical protein
MGKAGAQSPFESAPAMQIFDTCPAGGFRQTMPYIANWKVLS